MAHTMPVYDDNFDFEELARSFSFQKGSDDTEMRDSGLSKCTIDFIKAKYGNMTNFYNPKPVVETDVMNGFTRIEKLRKALGALDRSGWDRSYHQRIFHVIFIINISLVFHSCTYYCRVPESHFHDRRLF